MPRSCFLESFKFLEGTRHTATRERVTWCMSLTAQHTRDAFQTSTKGLNQNSLPMRLWRKAKKFGIWNPSEIDFSRDAADWKTLSDLERGVLIHQTGLFQAGEESVTLDLLPLIGVIAREGRLEEEMFLTSFLWEEAKHVDAFDTFWSEVAQHHPDLTVYHTASYREIFYQALPKALHRLSTDHSPVAQAEASVTYNMIVEGVLAETGYHSYAQMLSQNNILPGMQTVMGHFKRDESRHIAYGVHLLSRLVAEHGDPVWEAIEARMQELIVPAIGVLNEVFERYEALPFGLNQDELVNFAFSQFQKRITRIERARGMSLEEVLGVESHDLEAAEVIA
jgi:ribonucleoside-diphosphate reductase beta chain